MGQEYILQLFYRMQPLTRPSWYDFLMLTCLHVCFMNWRSIDRRWYVKKRWLWRIILIKWRGRFISNFFLLAFSMKFSFQEKLCLFDAGIGASRCSSWWFSPCYQVLWLQLCKITSRTALAEPTFIHIFHWGKKRRVGKTSSNFELFAATTNATFQPKCYQRFHLLRILLDLFYYLTPQIVNLISTIIS